MHGGLVGGILKLLHCMWPRVSWICVGFHQDYQSILEGHMLPGVREYSLSRRSRLLWQGRDPEYVTQNTQVSSRTTLVSPKWLSVSPSLNPIDHWKEPKQSGEDTLRTQDGWKSLALSVGQNTSSLTESQTNCSDYLRSRYSWHFCPGQFQHYASKNDSVKTRFKRDVRLSSVFSRFLDFTDHFAVFSIQRKNTNNFDDVFIIPKEFYDMIEDDLLFHSGEFVLHSRS